MQTNANPSYSFNCEYHQFDHRSVFARECCLTQSANTYPLYRPCYLQLSAATFVSIVDRGRCFCIPSSRRHIFSPFNYYFMVILSPIEAGTKRTCRARLFRVLNVKLLGSFRASLQRWNHVGLINHRKAI